MTPRDRSRFGSLLIVTLWLVTILSVLAVTIARYLSTEIRLTKYRLAREQARALARSGIYLAMERLLQDARSAEPTYEPYDWLGDDWAVTSHDGGERHPSWVVALPSQGAGASATQATVGISITDEERKLNLNQADEATLTNFLHVPDLAKAIVDYRDPADETENRPERQPPYYAKNSPFVSLAELNDLPDLTVEQFDLLAAHASPYTMTLNINTASPEVFAALGVSQGAIERVVQFRDGPDGPEAHDADGIFRADTLLNTLQDLGLSDADRNLLSRLGTTSQVFRIVSEGVFADQRSSVHARIEAVIQRPATGSEAPKILTWRER